MLAFTAFAGCVSLVVGWLVTARLFALARRTDAAPERMLAIAFSGLFCIGYPLAAASRAPGLGETHEGSLLFTIAVIGMIVGTIALNRFPELVFRPGHPWAIALRNLAATGGIVAGAGCALAVAGARTRAEMVEAIGPWALGLFASIGLPFLWNAVESTLYYQRMRRRLALGLADPVTTHRFLLWAAASWAAVGQIATLAALRSVGIPILSALPMLSIALSSLVCSTCWWLAFFMPDAYRRRILGAGDGESGPIEAPQRDRAD